MLGDTPVHNNLIYANVTVRMNDYSFSFFITNEMSQDT